MVVGCCQMVRGLGWYDSVDSLLLHGAFKGVAETSIGRVCLLMKGWRGSADVLTVIRRVAMLLEG